jgi:hypothetical protein
MLNNVKKCHKSSINGPFSIAMLNNQKVYIYMLEYEWLVNESVAWKVYWAGLFSVLEG